MKKININTIKIYIDLDSVVSDIYEQASTYLKREINNHNELHEDYIIPAIRGKLDHVSNYPYLEATFNHEYLKLDRFIRNTLTGHSSLIVCLESGIMERNVQLQKLLWLNSHYSGKKLVFYKTETIKNSLCSRPDSPNSLRILIDRDFDTYNTHWQGNCNKFIKHESIDSTIEQLTEIIDEVLIS